MRPGRAYEPLSAARRQLVQARDDSWAVPEKY